MRKQNQQTDFEDITDKPTPNYDKVCTNLRKLVSASCQTFVDDACKALRADWYRDASDAAIKGNFRARQRVRDKILDDWSKERNHEGIWKESVIQWFFPDWLKAAGHQSDAVLDNLDIAREKRYAKKVAIDDKQKQALRNYTGSLSEKVIIPEAEPEPKQTDFDMQLEPEMQDLGEEGKDTMTIYGEINGKAKEMIHALLQKKTMPGPDEDIIVDYVKPTREMRRSFVKEVKHSSHLSLKSLQRNLATLDYVLNDMLEIIETELRE